MADTLLLMRTGDLGCSRTVALGAIFPIGGTLALFPVAVGRRDMGEGRTVDKGGL